MNAVEKMNAQIEKIRKETLNKLSSELKSLSKEDLEEVLYNAFKREFKTFNGEKRILKLDFLDFRRFRCDVDISHMWVHGNLFQENQCAGKNIYQTEQWCDGDLHQDESKSRWWINEEN